MKYNIQQWFLNFNVHQNHYRALTTQIVEPYLQNFWFSRSRSEKAQECIFIKFPRWWWHCWSRITPWEPLIDPGIKSRGGGAAVYHRMAMGVSLMWYLSQKSEGGTKEYSREREQPVQRSWGKSMHGKEAGLTGVEWGRGSRRKWAQPDPVLGHHTDFDFALRWKDSRGFWVKAWDKPLTYLTA